MASAIAPSIAGLTPASCPRRSAFATGATSMKKSWSSASASAWASAAPRRGAMDEKIGPGVGDTGPVSEDIQRDASHSTATAASASAITVVIGGAPVAKGRPRMTRKGFAYTPSATRKYEAHARMAAQLAMDGRPPIEAPVRIEVLAELPIPASWSERKKAEAITGTVRPTSRPDVDHYVKR